MYKYVSFNKENCLCDRIMFKTVLSLLVVVSEFSVGHLQLGVGLIYYVTVSACNSADMCTTVCSDGVILDSSPPVPGHVMDGVDVSDSQFQASR